MFYALRKFASYSVYFHLPILNYSSNMASLKLLLKLALFTLLVNGCIFVEEDEDPVPCNYFSCNINGEPFESHGEFLCDSKGAAFDSLLSIRGHDCRVSENGFSTVVFDIDGVTKPGKFPINQVNCGYRDGQGRPVPHNVEIAGEAHLVEFALDAQSKVYSGGYTRGTFWFTAYNEDSNDTVYVTDGQFCVYFN